MPQKIDTDPKSPTFGMPIGEIDTDPKSPTFGMPKQQEQTSAPTPASNSTFWNLVGPTLNAINPLPAIETVAGGLWDATKHPLQGAEDLYNFGKNAYNTVNKGFNDTMLKGIVDWQDAMAANNLKDKAKLYAGAAGNALAAQVPFVGPSISNNISSMSHKGVNSEDVGKLIGDVAPFALGPISRGAGLVTSALEDVPVVGAAIKSVQKIPAKIAEQGLGIGKKIALEHPNIGQTLIDQRIFSPLGGKPQSLLNTLDDELVQNAANVSKNPLTQTRDVMTPENIMKYAQEYTYNRAGVGASDAYQAEQLDAINNYVNKFMDANTDLQGNSRDINALQGLGIKRKSGNIAAWTQSVNDDPLRIKEFMTQGTALGTRQGLEDIFKHNNLPSAIDNLKLQQDLLGVTKAARERSLMNAVLRRSVEAATAGTMGAAAWKPILAMESIRNPLVTATLGNLVDIGAKAAAAKPLLAGYNIYQPSAFFNVLNGQYNEQ